ncbi:MAG TPA: DUF4422 domain-containing protein [Clostridia bacterium]|nr:DUF4422 domain-containing protein [Clostridia bacterium]
MKDIKILVSCHKESYVPKCGMLFPIQVGAKGKKHLEGMLYDDAGENISEKNSRYCELTAQYFAWKNLDAEYYGFFHYRRYLSFNEERFQTDSYNNIVFSNINDDVIEKLCLSEDRIEEFIGDNDIIVPVPMNLKNDVYKNVYKHYKGSPDHDIEDLEEAIAILKRLYPDFSEYADEYLNSSICYFLNMYIMKKEIFHAYCEWLFPILDEFDSHKNYECCNNYECRTPGLLAERLFGIYLTYLKATNNELKVKEAQQCFFEDTSYPYLLPAFAENNIAVCLASSDKYIPYAAVAIQSIISNSSKDSNYDLIVLCNNVDDRNKVKLQRVVNGLNNFSLRFINGESYIASKKLNEKENINTTTYLRLGALDFLKYYSKAVYLDCDLVVNADIAKLYNIDVNDYFVGAVKDSIEAGWCKQTSNPQTNYNKNVLKLKREFEYFNAGVLLMNLDELRKEYSASSLIKMAQSFKWLWLDQDVLNMVCDGRTKFLEPSWNVLVHDLKVQQRPENDAPHDILEGYLNALKNPKVIHFAGRVIPTVAPDVDLADIFWKYARQSIFYEKILSLIVEENADFKSKKQKLSFKARLIKTFFPKNTKRRQFAKKIYYKLTTIKYAFKKR